MITKDQVVLLHYTLSDDAGNQIETTKGGDAVAYLHGHDNMIPAFEKALEGHKSGDHLAFDLTTDEGYGQRIEGSVQRVPVKHLQGHPAGKKGVWKKGMTAWVNTEQGERQVTIVKVGRFMVDVDTNHPLAGKGIHFDVDIVDVREATADEISHGHAHGPGGHQHD